MAQRNVNVELNLAPFIDLFSTLVCFLLMTAVWNQIASLSTNTDNITSSTSATPPDPNKVNFTCTILQDRVEFGANETIVKIPIINNEIDIPTLERTFKDWKEKYPDRKDIILNTENTVPYRHMIKVFDTLVGSGWHDVGVNTQ